MRKVIIAVAFLFSSVFAVAQVPTSGNVFFGYTYYNTPLSSAGRASLNGWEASVEGKVLPLLGVVADFSSNYGSENFLIVTCPVSVTNCTLGTSSESVSEENYLFGPRLSISVGKFRPFAEGMIGAGHVNAHVAGSSTSFASALGGGLDYRLFHFLESRAGASRCQNAIPRCLSCHRA